MLRGNEKISTESVASLVQRVKFDWKPARENLERSVGLQKKYYDKKHRDIKYEVGDLVLLTTRNLKMMGTPGKLQKRFVGPFGVIETIGHQTYKLALPDVEEPYYEIERILRWRKIKRNKKTIKEYLVLWKGYLVGKASWVQSG